MLNGNISNAIAPVIAMDLDSLLFTETLGEKKTFFDRFFPKKIRNRTLNQETLKKLKHLWNKYDLQVYLTTFEIKDEDELSDLYDMLNDEGIGVSNIVFHQEWEDIRYRLGNGRYQYFFTGNLDLVLFLGKNSFHINEFSGVFY